MGPTATAYKQQVAKVFGPVLGANLAVSNELAAVRGTKPARRAPGRAPRAGGDHAGDRCAQRADRSRRPGQARRGRQTGDRPRGRIPGGGRVRAQPPDDRRSQPAAVARVRPDRGAHGRRTRRRRRTVHRQRRHPADVLGPDDQSHAEPPRTQPSAPGREPGHEPGRAGGNTSSPTPSAPAASRGTSCGGGLYAGPNTSCTFARNVRSAYWEAPGASATVRVFSPVTNQTYTMSCSPSGSGTTCSGGNNASVTF